MSVELLNEGVDDVEEIVIAWLQPLRRTAQTRVSGDPLPFTLVTHIASEERADEFHADELVSVHTMCDKNLGVDNAKEEADATHRRMLLLGRYLEDVSLHDGRLATIDYVDSAGTPIWVPYGDDQILRKVGRYKIGLSYVTTQGS
jgi:hypothetical protein